MLARIDEREDPFIAEGNFAVLDRYAISYPQSLPSEGETRVAARPPLEGSILFCCRPVLVHL